MIPDRNDAMPQGALYHEAIAEGWAAGYQRDGFGRRLQAFRAILDRAVQPAERWLDLGCGAGVMTGELLQRGATVTAIDGAPAMLESARIFLGAEQSASVTWGLGDVTRLDNTRDGAFDGVLCSSVIEYVEQPQAMLAEIRRVLRPSGKLLISLPPTWSLVRTIQKIIRTLARPVGIDRYSYLAVSRFEVSPAKVAAWLDSAGFAVGRVTSFDPLLKGAWAGRFRPALLIIEATKKA